MKNFKLSKSIPALLTASVMLLSSCGISDRMNEANINGIMSSDVSFDDVLKSISDTSSMDEKLNLLEYKYDVDSFESRREDESITEAGYALANLGEKILKIKISELLNIKLSSIREFEIYSEDNECQDVYVKMKYDNFRKTLLLCDEARDVGLAIDSANTKQIYNIEFIDKMYKAIERLLLTKGEYNSDRESISLTYDDQKIDKFKKYIKK